VDFFIDKQDPKELSLPKVQYSGALRNFMMKSDISAKFDLRKLKKLPYLYALGAKENLKGEILILNSKVLNSSVSTGNKLKIDKNLNAKASLIVYSQVENWTESNIPDGVSKREEFERFLEKEALNKGININLPFAFLIKGPIKTNKWHVIDWDPSDKNHTHSKHINSGLNGTLKNEDVRMLGFYSKNHTGIFTHHTTNMHIHFVNKEETISGHSDNLTIGSGMRLSLPKLVKP
jgi:acetolactate decarboxylase